MIQRACHHLAHASIARIGVSLLLMAVLFELSATVLRGWPQQPINFSASTKKSKDDSTFGFLDWGGAARRRPANQQSLMENIGNARRGDGYCPPADFASWWWTKNLDKILNASLFPVAVSMTDDAEYEYRYDQSSAANVKLYQEVLRKAGTAFQLEEVLLTNPSNKDITRVYEILLRRWSWFFLRSEKGNTDGDAQTMQSPAPPPPLKILVMGGSTAVGGDCDQPVMMKRRRKMQSRNSTATSKDTNNSNSDENYSEWEDCLHVITLFDCNWSVRLESFVNSMLGYDAVRVVNIAQGGTNSEQGSTLVKYRLTFPDDWNKVQRMKESTNSNDIATKPITGPPDIIIHAYGTNDSNTKDTTKSETERIQKLHEQVTTYLNGFIQAVKESFGEDCQEHAPLLLFLDDYNMGFFEGSILGDRTYRMVLREVSDWYSVMAVSSAKLIERLVFPNAFGKQDVPFSPENWEEKYKAKRRGPHYPYTGHIATVWSLAYSAFTSAVKFCNSMELQEHLKQHHHQIPSSNHNPNNYIQVPIMDYSLDIHSVSNALKQQEHNILQENCSEDFVERCEMAWTAPRTIDGLKKAINPYIGYNHGWNPKPDMSTGKPRKPGVVAEEIGALLRFDLLDLSIPVQLLTVQYLRSYGEAWKGSEVLITVRSKQSLQNWTQNAQTKLSGIHNSKTSIMYKHEIRFPKQEIGSDVQVEIKLIGGTTFKLLGMMLCSR